MTGIILKRLTATPHHEFKRVTLLLGLGLDRMLALLATKTRVDADARLIATPELKNRGSIGSFFGNPQSAASRRDCVTCYPTNLINPRERCFEMQEASTPYSRCGDLRGLHTGAPAMKSAASCLIAFFRARSAASVSSQSVRALGDTGSARKNRYVVSRLLQCVNRFLRISDT